MPKNRHVLVAANRRYGRSFLRIHGDESDIEIEVRPYGGPEFGADACVENGGEGGIRTPVPVTRQDAFEAPPLRPLRYLSVV